MSLTILRQAQYPVRLYLQLFVGGLVTYLRYLCLFAYNGVQHILTMWVIWRISCWRQGLLAIRGRLGSPPVFGVVRVAHHFSFLCCVFCFVSLRHVSCFSQCCQFLPIVHSWLPHRFSLTFICFVGLRPVSCFSVLPVSPNCSFLIDPTVFSIVYSRYKHPLTHLNIIYNLLTCGIVIVVPNSSKIQLQNHRKKQYRYL